MAEKKYKIPGYLIKPVALGRGCCIATDHIVVNGMKIGFMYREEPSHSQDSGWRFFSGLESQEYTDDPNNLALYDVNTIANYDSAILPHLDAPIRSAFGRVAGTDRFAAEEFSAAEE